MICKRRTYQPPHHQWRNRLTLTKLIIGTLTAWTMPLAVANNQAEAQIIFESANLGDSTTFGASVNDGQFDGVHFHLDDTVQVTEVGGISLAPGLFSLRLQMPRHCQSGLAIRFRSHRWR